MTRSYIALFLALSAGYLASDEKTLTTPRKNNDLEA